MLASLRAWAGDVGVPVSPTRNLHLRGDAQTVITQALAQFGETAQFSGQPPHQPIRFDLDDATVKVVHSMLERLTRTLLVTTGQGRILIVPDTVPNRKQYLIEDTETINLPGLTKEASSRKTDVQNILTTVFGIPHASFQSSGVTLTAAPEVLDQVNATIRSLYTHDAQVQLHVRCYLVSRNRSLDLGLTPPASTTVFNVLTEAENLITENASVIQEAIEEGLISSSASELEIAALLIEYGYASSSPLGSSFLEFGNGITATGVEPDSVTLSADLTTTTTTELQDVTLHLLDHETGKLHIGQKYPVMTAEETAVSPLATSVSATSTTSYTLPTIEYEDIGLMLEATPSIHGDGSLDLNLKLALRSLDGTTLNSIPVIDTQEFTSALSVRAGMTTVMVSNLTHTDDGTNTGLPGLPTTNRSHTGQDQQLVVTITPELTRAARPGIESAKN